MRIKPYLLLGLSSILFVSCSNPTQEAKQDTDISTTKRTEEETKETTQEREGVNVYAPSGIFAPDKLGYTLPDLKTFETLEDLGNESDETLSGLYKNNKAKREDSIGIERIPYHIFVPSSADINDQVQKIIENTYYEKVRPIRLADALLLPSLSGWKEEQNAKEGILTATDDTGIKVVITGRLGKAQTHEQILEKMGEIYANDYPLLLENYNRQGFYLYSKIDKAGAIAFFYEDADENHSVKIIIHFFDEAGNSRKIVVTGKDESQVIAWYFVLNGMNNWGQADGATKAANE